MPTVFLALLFSYAGLSVAQTVTATISVCDDPQSVAVNPNTNKVYVACQGFLGPPGITVIDAKNGTTSIATNFTPHAVAVNAVTNKIYVANNDSNDGNISVIDGATNTLTTVMVHFATGSQEIAVNPQNNKIYVVNNRSNNVTLLDGATNTVTEISVGNTPQAIAINPGTNKVYVLNVGDDTVTVIDGKTNETTSVSAASTIGSAFEETPAAIAFNPITNQLLVSGSEVMDPANNYRLMTVFTAIDGTTNIASSFKVEPFPDSAFATPSVLSVNPATNGIYAAYPWPTVRGIAINGATNVVTPLSLGEDPVAMAYNASANQTYVVNSDSNTVTIINGATNKTSNLNVGTLPVAVAVNPTTNTVYVANSVDSTVSVIASAQPVAAATATTVSADANPQQVGTKVTFTAYVAAPSVTAKPTGTVTFSVDGSGASTVILDSTAHAAFATSSVKAGSHTVKAAYNGTSGFGASNATMTETITPAPAAQPIFSPAAGTYTSMQTVSITDSTAGAVLYYTLDGSSPTTSSARYTGALNIGKTTKICAIAVASGYPNSTVSCVTYTINLPLAATPTFTLPGATYTAAQAVGIADGTRNATIYYTLDGSTPTINSARYAAPLAVAQTTTIKAMAAASGYANSAVATATYTIKLPPASAAVFKPAGGTYGDAQAVTLTSATPNAMLYYTLDGTAPTAASTKYSAPIVIAAPGTVTTVKAIATASGFAPSAVVSAAFTEIASPQAFTLIATAIATPNATLNASMNDFGAAGQAWFLWGTSPTALTSTTAKKSIAALANSQSVGAPITGLKAKTTYYFQPVVSTVGGITYGAVQSFTTN